GWWSPPLATAGAPQSMTPALFEKGSARQASCNIPVLRPNSFDGGRILIKTFAVLLGGAFGTGCRYWLSTLVYSLIVKPTFPWANLIINVSGSLIIGVLAGLFEQRVLVSPALRVALLTGVLGGYTTFSSFAFETYTLLRDGELGLAVLNSMGSVV